MKDHTKKVPPIHPEPADAGRIRPILTLRDLGSLLDQRPLSAKLSDHRSAISRRTAKAMIDVLPQDSTNFMPLNKRVALIQPPSADNSVIAAVKDIGNLVRETRRARKLSQQAFSDLAGVGRRFLSELENGKTTLEFDKVLQVATAAGIDLFARKRG